MRNRLLSLLLLLAACGPAEEQHPYDSPPQAPLLAEGVQAPALAAGQEVLVFTSSRLSDEASGYSVNLIRESHVLGAEVLVYDPRQPGRLLSVGRPDYGRVDATTFTGPSPRERQKVKTVELAWDAQRGFWGMGYEPINDEWYLIRWGLTDVTRGGQTFAADFWALPVETDKQNTLYWEDHVAGLEFLDGVLHATSSADLSSYGNQGGQLYRLDVPLPPTYADLPSPNNDFYMAAPVPGPLLTLPDLEGFTGDLARRADGSVLAMKRTERLPEGTPHADTLLRVRLDSTPAVEQVGEPIPLEPGEDFEALAEVGGVVYGITEFARVFRIDAATGAAVLHEDLRGLLNTPDALRVRAGTKVVLP